MSETVARILIGVIVVAVFLFWLFGSRAFLRRQRERERAQRDRLELDAAVLEALLTTPKREGMTAMELLEATNSHITELRAALERLEGAGAITSSRVEGIYPPRRLYGLPPTAWSKQPIGEVM